MMNRILLALKRPFIIASATVAVTGYIHLSLSI